VVSVCVRVRVDAHVALRMTLMLGQLTYQTQTY